MGNLMRFGVSMEENLLEQFDRHIVARGYTNRSEAFRDLAREELSRLACAAPEAHAVATLTLRYQHQEYQLSERLTSRQHEHHHLVLSTLHVHLTHEQCFEVLVLKGPAGELRALADNLKATRGVLNAQLVMMETEGSDHSYHHEHT